MKTNNSLVRLFVVLLLATFGLLSLGAQSANAQAYNLDQCRNGAPDSHNNCGDAVAGVVGWNNGNAGAQNSHYAEGGSIAYRNTLTGLTPGTMYTLRMGFKIKHGDHHAIDYLTHVNRPGTVDVGTGVIDPCDGAGIPGAGQCPIGVNATIANVGGVIVDFEDIPQPTLCQTPALLGYFGASNQNASQACTSRANLIANEGAASVQMMLVGGTFNGTIQNGDPGSLTDDNSYNDIVVRFTPTVSTVVLAWGGHIGSRLDWGYRNVELTDPASAGGIAGSPYHMDSKGLCFAPYNGGTNVDGPGCDVGGDQDRSLSAAAVIMPAAITIIKSCTPNNQTTANLQFNFTSTQPAGGTFDPNFSLLCADNIATTDLVENTFTKEGILTFGTYTVTESAFAGWTLDSITCTDQDGGTTDYTTNVGTRTVTIPLEAGEHATCTFNNRQLKGKIRVNKRLITGPSTIPDQQGGFVTGYGNSLNLSPTDWDIKVGSLAQEAAIAYPNYREYELDPGNYSVAESVSPAGYTFAVLDCGTVTQGGDAPLADAAPQIPPAGGSGNVTLQADQIILCTFTNRSLPNTIIVRKETTPSNSTNLFTFNTNFASPNNFDLDGVVGTCGVSNNCKQTNLLSAGAGNTINEVAEAGWDLTGLGCSVTVPGAVDPNTLQSKTTVTAAIANNPDVNITLGNGSTVDCTFTNTQHATVTVTKEATPDDTQNFAFTTSGTGPAGFTGGFNLDDDALAGGDAACTGGNCLKSQTFTFNGTQLGAKTIAEAVTSGWALTSLSCSKGTNDINTRTVSFTLAAGDAVTCTFSNSKPDLKIEIGPPTATNTVGEEHTFNVTITQIPNGATLDDLVDALSVSVDPAATITDNTCVDGLTYGGDAVATCSFKINSASAVVYTANASATTTINGVALTRDTNPATAEIPAGPGGSGPAVKTYVDANISLSPLNDVNRVGDAHTITATVLKDLGNGPFVAAVGVTVTFSVTSGVATFVGNDNDCVTNASGQCSVQINTSTPGNNVISATTSVTIDTETVVRTTGTQANTDAGGSGTAQKAYVNARIRIGETETNQVGEQHIFTVTIQQNIGAGWVAVPNGTTATITILPNPQPAGFSLLGNTCAAPGTVSGTCTVTINSTVPAIYTVTAQAAFNVQANGLNQPFNISTDGTGENSGAAIKTYEGGQIKIVKQVIPETDNTSSFNFAKNFGGPAIPALADDGEYLSIYLPVGSSYTVTETLPTGWELTSISCTLGGTRNGNAVEGIVVSNNAINTCTFTNTAKGTITIVKEVNIPFNNGADPNSAVDPTNFAFDPSAGVNSNANFFLDDDGLAGGSASCDNTPDANVENCLKSITFNDVLAGVHTVSELFAPGWDLSNLVCTGEGSTFKYLDKADGSTAFEFGDRTAEVNLGPGSSVTCTFTNRQPDMPVTKLIDGRTPNCVDTPGSPAGVDSCIDPVMGEVFGKFSLSLYVDTDENEGAGADLSQLLVGPVPVPPAFDPPAPTEFSFSICEATPPAGWKLIATGDVVVNAIPNQVADTTPTVYTPAGAPAGTRCFDVRIPAQTTEYQININNVPLSRIIVDKVTNPSGDAQSFAFTTTGSGYSNFNLTDAAAANNQELNGGNGTSTVVYTVTEGALANWDLTGLTCDKTIPNSANNADAAINTSTININAANRQASITLQSGATVSCTFTNTKRGKIIVDKVTVPSGDTQSFAFTSNFGVTPLTDAAAPFESAFLVPGAYNVSETVPTGWDLTSTNCVSSIGDTEAAGSLELDAGETITCTFTNTKRGSIKVTKTAIGGNGTFDFTSNFGLPATLTTVGGTKTETVNDLAPGSGFSLSETSEAGWDITTGLECKLDNGAGASTGTPSGTPTNALTAIQVEAGKVTACTITNTKRARLKVVKDMVGGTATFTFDGPGGAPDTDVAISTDLGFFERTDLVPGSYNWKEDALAGWDLTAIDCDDANSTETVATATAGFVLEPGEFVTCTFTNRKRGRIIVDKNTLPANDPQLFTFTPVGFNGDATFQLAHSTDPFNTGFTVVPGAYSVSETVPTGWDLTSATCDQGETPASLDVEPGETVTCTFTNTKRGKIIVIKDAVPNDNWDFAYTSPNLSPANFMLDDDAGVAGATNDLSNTMMFNNVVPGTYTITESNDPAVSGFDITAITCDDAAGANDSTGNIVSGAATYRVDPGETVTCTFVNTRQIQAHTIGYWGNWNSCTGGKQTANELLHPEKWLLDEVLGINDPNDTEPQHYATSQLLIGVDGDTPDRPGQVDGTPDVVRTCADGVNLLRKRDVISKENRANDGAYNMAAQLVAALANYAAGATQCGTYNGTNTGNVGVTGAIGQAKALLVEIGFDGSGSFLTPGHPLRTYAIQLGSILDTYNNSIASACSANVPSHP